MTRLYLLRHADYLYDLVVLESTREVIPRLGLQPDMRVLDVGSGMGGAAFYIAETAETCGVRVHGVDSSQNIVTP